MNKFTFSNKNTAELECLAINILTCDPKTLVIDYANKASVSTLNLISHLLPSGVNGDNIVGQCIDIFHKTPSKQRNLLADSSNLPYSTIIRLGSEMLDLHVDAIYSGKLVSKLVLSWSVCTERENLKIMADNMPINIMMCDPKTLELTYVNKTSQDTLKSIKHLLPSSVDVDNIIGQCIDVFHKNPEYQRNLLSDPKNLPYRAKISLGNERLNLDVSAIIDKNNYYVGPMVSWSIITDQDNLSRNVLSVADDVEGSSFEVEQTAKALSCAAEKTSEQSTTVAAAAEEASANVQTVASAAEEMTASIKSISEQVSMSNQTALKAVDLAKNTGDVVQRLSEASDEIGNVVNMINDIAEQTNLLALNATIEAARAGDAGKGFAVVASEVKSLASETTKATDAIKSQISNMQVATNEAVSAIASIQETISIISETSNIIAESVEEQASTTAEISSNIQEASQATGDVSENIVNIQNVSSETGAAALQLLGVAESLSSKSGDMKKQISDFIKG